MIMTDKELMRAANEARKFAYAPYSSFKVGAALLTESGKLYTGCNIENSSYTPTVCAERVAVFKAVSDGERNFVKIAVVGGKGDKPLNFCAPCGVCRQVLAEFCDESFVILLGNEENFSSYGINEILPFSFTKKDLNKI